MPLKNPLPGIMQGRLVPPEKGRFQSFPRMRWRDEIGFAQAAGLGYIEWIYDGYGESCNPIGSDEGIAGLNALKHRHGIATPAICADWFMEFPLIRCSQVERESREARLAWLLRRAGRIGASRVVLPFVDASTMQSEQEKAEVIEVLQRALPVAVENGVEIHLETDLDPQRFAAFLDEIRHPLLKVNYDTGNSSGLGYDVVEEFAAYGGRIGSIHIKDRLRRPEGGVVTLALGQGSANFGRVFASIRAIGYAGDLTLQVARGESGDELAWVKRQLEYLSPYLRTEK